MTSTRCPSSAWLRLVAALAFLLVPRFASAHAVGVSRGDYTVDPHGVTAEIAFARGELAVSFPALDANSDGTIDASELASASGREVIRTLILDGIDIGTPQSECTAALDRAVLTEGDGVIFGAHWVCPAPVTRVSIAVKLFAKLSDGHRHIARARAGAVTKDDVLYAKHDTIAIDVPAAGAAATPGAAHEEAPSSFLAFIGMGVRHILTGYDHLLFLFGLVLVGGRVRSLIGVVTAFTIAHSITLAIATVGTWAPSPRIVEPAIALSIAYVGVENFFVKDASKRWRITFPFGLIHGFGFAGALREIALPRAQIPVALVGFNLGVEAGQLAVMALVVPLVIVLRKQPWFEGRGVKVLSAGVVVAGLVWFVERVAAAY